MMQVSISDHRRSLSETNNVDTSRKQSILNVSNDICYFVFSFLDPISLKKVFFLSQKFHVLTKKAIEDFLLSHESIFYLTYKSRVNISQFEYCCRLWPYPYVNAWNVLPSSNDANDLNSNTSLQSSHSIYEVHSTLNSNVGSTELTNSNNTKGIFSEKQSSIMLVGGELMID
jgi:hypothetical protein